MFLLTPYLWGQTFTKINDASNPIVSDQGPTGAAIGTKVWAKAVINGVPIWQMREVSAQNNFNGQNSLRVHFGLGDAAVIDSLIIEWPAVAVEKFANLGINNFYEAIEEQSFTPDPVTSIEEDGATIIPKQFKLRQNYPNPFNPSTNIRYNLSDASNVKLMIYDMLGRRVRTLLNNEKQSAGYYTVNWNGRVDTGQQVASGVYIYRINTSEKSIARKMILLK